MSKRTPKSVKASCDKLVSLIVRSHGKCRRCGGINGKLEAAHIHSRRFNSLRHDLDNLVCLDSRCHRWAHDNPTQFTYWLEEILGKKHLEKLEIKKNLVTKRKLADWLELESELKQKLKDIT